MNTMCQETLATLSNPRWETEMYFDLMRAQAQDAHSETLESIRGWRNFYKQTGNEVMERLMAGCETIYQTGYDL